MSTIVTRAGKGSPLTHTEVDNNFTNLNTDKAEDSTVVKLSGDQTIAGTKTFSSTISGSITGNAGTVTDGVVTSGSYANPSWITSLDDGKVLPTMTSNSGKFLTTDGTNSSWSILPLDPSNVSITGGSINGTTVGASNPSTGSFTTLTSNSTTTLNGTTIPSSKTLVVTTDIGSSVQAYSSELNAIANSGNSMFKNRIINGAMQIDQRNAGASVSVTNAAAKFSADRWFCDNANGAGTIAYSAQQVSDAPTGFSYSLKATVTTSGATAAGDYQYVRQNIEGYNFADFQFGTANAQTFTMSFWVKSSLTGTFGGYFGAALNARFRTFSYTISSANTWEYKTVVITGDTAGTWVGATNGVGLQVAWSLACGSTYLGATGSWSSSLYLGATGQTNITATSGATWQVTGVQLEKGSTATSFDYRPYGTELALCQRYYLRLTGGSQFTALAVGAATSTTAGTYAVSFPVTMRAVPTIGYSDLIATDNANYLPAITGTITGNLGTNGGRLNAAVASGQTAFRPQTLAANSTSSFLEFPAEL